MLYVIFTLFVVDAAYGAFHVGFSTETKYQVGGALVCLYNAAAAGAIYSVLP